MSALVFVSHSATSAQSEPKELVSLLTDWGYRTVSFTDLDQAWAILSSDSPPEIFLFEWSEGFSESLIFLQSIWDMRNEFPFYSFLYGDAQHESEINDLLNAGVHDIITLPLNEKHLKAKLEVAKQLVLDKRALVDSAKVMERYAKHVDRLAAERARQIVHAERLSTLGTMSAGLAHEIKNPLSYISTSLETTKTYWKHLAELLVSPAAESLQIDPTMKERILNRLPKALERMRNGLERIDKLMQGLKSFARSSQTEKKEFPLNSCIEMALEMCETSLKYHVEVVRELSEDLPLIKIEPQQIEQVLINLVMNAGHALEKQEGGKIFVRSWSDSESIYLQVSDNGPGIPRSKLETIWEPYYTTKEEGKGTGLGLAISRSLIRDNGGTITVKNREEGGAEFTIAFRLSTSSTELPPPHHGEPTS